MTNMLPCNEVAAAIAVHSNETKTGCQWLKHRGNFSQVAYLPLFVKPVLSSPNQYQLLSSELALFKMAPPCAWIRVPDVSVKLSLG